MNDDELKSLWRQQELTPPAMPSAADLVAMMKKKMRKFDRTIFWRDAREWAGCVVVFYIFYMKLQASRSSLSRAGCWLVLLSAVFIAGELIYTRYKFKPRAGTPSLREFLQFEVRKVGWQVRLLETVLWWYILPIMIGAELCMLGETRDLGDKVAVTISFVFVSAVLWWVNRYAARKTLRPLQQELENTLKSAPEFSEVSGENKSNP